MTPNKGPAYAGIICPHHGNVDIDYGEYLHQMGYPDSRWKCPKCGFVSEFDDARFEEINFHDEEN